MRITDGMTTAAALQQAVMTKGLASLAVHSWDTASKNLIRLRDAPVVRQIVPERTKQKTTNIPSKEWHGTNTLSQRAPHALVPRLTGAWWAVESTSAGFRAERTGLGNRC
jgi:hypothetical protein